MLSGPTRRLFAEKKNQKWMHIEENAYLNSLSTRQGKITLIDM